MVSRKNTYRAVAVVLLLALLLGSIFTYRYFIAPRTPPTGQEQTWMTVFVHGTFGTTLGLFSVFNVIKGQVENTNYKRMTSHMRYDPYFHQFQAMLEPGLYPITPSFAPTKNKNKPCVVPLAAAYQTLTDYVAPNKEDQLFYTFGWSGLMSQQRRRKEAIRFYNMLTSEYQKLKERGLDPKVRIITHSHGGNVVLNLAGVDALAQKYEQPTKKTFPDDDQLTSMQELYKLMQQACTPEKAATKKNQKKWDYRPTPAPFRIDEFILLGTPLQPETIPFFLSSFFKNIFSIYSDGDIIQGMDWVSTRRYYSEKRLSCLPAGISDKPNVRQIRVTLNKPTGEPKKETAPTQLTEPSLMGTITTVWNTLFTEKPAKEKPDPDHKELWFMGWSNANRTLQAQEHIKPYPYAIFIPFFQALVAQHPTLHDIDVRLKFAKDKVSLISYEHNKTAKVKKMVLPQVLLKGLQKKIAPWQPDDVTPNKQMNILHRYSKMLSE